MEFDARGVFDEYVSFDERRRRGERTAEVDWWQLSRDVILSEQEFRRSAGYLSGETAESEGRERGLSDWAKGLGWGALAVASVTPFGTLGKLGRAARAGQDVWGYGRAAGGAARAARVADRWDVPEGVDDLTRSVLEFQRDAGLSFDEALEAVNRTRVREGLPVVPTGLSAPRVSSAATDAALADQPLQGESLLGSIMSPITASQQFGAVSVPEAKRIFESMAARGPLRVVSAEDLATPQMFAMLDRMAEYISSGRASVSGDYPEFVQFQPFAEALGLNRAALLSGKSGETFRPMMNAIVQGRYDEVLEDLAGQINNVFTLIDDDVFRLAFYPFMSNSTFAAARASGTDPVLLAAVSGVASAGAAPVGEAQLVGDIFDWVKDLRVVRGVLEVPERADVPGMMKTGAQAYAQLVNNPDWLSNRVPGLASKTYVYAMLKMNPRMVRAMVIDRVDASARLAAFEMKPGWAWATEGAANLEGVELALGNFANRVVASALGVPPAAVQENVWALWRVLRDLQVGRGPSRSSGVKSASGVTMEELLSKAKMPAAHRRIFEKNLENLREEVVSGGPASRYWEQSPSGILIPRTDMPIDGFLPPAIRTPENVEALAESIGNADAIGRGLRDKKPWAPIALAMTVLATPLGKGAVIGGAVGGVVGAGSPAEASEGGMVSASIPFAGAGLGAGLGAALGAASAGAALGATRFMGSWGGPKGLTAALRSNPFTENVIDPAASTFSRAVQSGISNVPNITPTLPADAIRAIDRLVFDEVDFAKADAISNMVFANPDKYGGSNAARNSLDSLQEDFVKPYEVDNIVENELDALLHWQMYGDKNIQSILRSGDIDAESSGVQDAIDDYMAYNPDGDPSDVLNFLRRNAINSIQHLDTVSTSYVSNKSFVTYRGINMDNMQISFGDEFINDLITDPDSLVGLRFSDVAYVTTTMRPGYASFMAKERPNGMRDIRNVVLQIEVPAGKPFVSVSGMLDPLAERRIGGGPAFTGEAEILLPRESSFEILRVLTPEDVERFGDMRNPNEDFVITLRYLGTSIDPVVARRPLEITI